MYKILLVLGFILQFKMVSNMIRTVSYEDVVDDDETLSSGYLTSDLRKKILKYSSLYNFWVKTQQLQSRRLILSFDFWRIFYVCLPEMHNMNIRDGCANIKLKLKILRNGNPRKYFKRLECLQCDGIFPALLNSHCSAVFSWAHGIN